MKLVLLAAVLAVLATSTRAGGTLSDHVDELTRLLSHISNVLGRFRPKRVCVGYMCSYSHTSNAAGKTAVHNTLMRFLYNCAKDPKCSPGKRRKRSLPMPADSAPLLRLTRYQHPSWLTS